MRVAIVTCAELPQLDPSNPAPLDPDSEVLLPALEARGVQAESVVWTDPSLDLSGFDRAVLRSTWDYHERPQEFLQWVRRAAAETDLWNRAATIEWNMDKRYLRELEDAGVPTIPTLWPEPGEELAVVEWDEVVVKPVVDLGARNLVRVPGREAAAVVRELERPALVQPFLPGLPSDGELSLIFVRGELEHAVLKRPAANDFRVQPQYGGTVESVDAPEAAVDVARRALSHAPEPCLYARVDLVEPHSELPKVIELELIEPLLFLAQSRTATDVFARVIAAG